MNATIIYGFCLTVCLALAAAMTSTAPQSTLFVMAVCSSLALALTTMIDLAGNRSQSKA